MMKSRFLKTVVIVAFLAVCLTLSGAGAQVYEGGCYVCYNLEVPGETQPRVICWDFDTGVGSQYCQEWGGFCIRTDPCQTVLPPDSA